MKSIQKKISITILFGLILSGIFVSHSFYLYAPAKFLHTEATNLQKTTAMYMMHTLYSKWGLVHELVSKEEILQEFKALKADNAYLKEENAILKNTLSLQEKNQDRVLGKVVFGTFSLGKNTIVIQTTLQKEKSQIKIGSPVFAGESLLVIGTITSLENDTATVQLFTGSQVYTPGFISIPMPLSEEGGTSKNQILESLPKDGVYQGILVGKSSGMLHMRVPNGINIPLESSTYTKDGLYVGSVVDVTLGNQNEQEVTILSPVNISHLRNISIGI
jgi:cell shape-determining protein MreC